MKSIDIDHKAGRVTTLIDDEDADLILGKRLNVEYMANGTPYVRIYTGRNKQMHLARFLMGCPAGQVDHKDGNTLDNRRSNLRVVTRVQNLQNRRGWGSTHKGVVFRPARPGKCKAHYEARINVDGKKTYIGKSETPEGAARLYDEAAIRHFGEYARLNFATVQEVA